MIHYFSMITTNPLNSISFKFFIPSVFIQLLFSPSLSLLCVSIFLLYSFVCLKACICCTLSEFQSFNSNRSAHPQLIWQKKHNFTQLCSPTSGILSKSTMVIKHLSWPIRKKPMQFLQKPFLSHWLTIKLTLIFTHKTEVTRLALVTNFHGRQT